VCATNNCQKKITSVQFEGNPGSEKEKLRVDAQKVKARNRRPSKARDTIDRRKELRKKTLAKCKTSWNGL